MGEESTSIEFTAGQMEQFKNTLQSHMIRMIPTLLDSLLLTIIEQALPSIIRNTKSLVENKLEVNNKAKRFMKEKKDEFNYRWKIREDYTYKRSRCDELVKCYKEQDEKIKNFVETFEMDDRNIKEEVIRIWNEDTLEDENRVKQKWTIKMQGMKKAYKKDRNFSRNHNRSRLQHRRNEWGTFAGGDNQGNWNRNNSPPPPPPPPPPHVHHHLPMKIEAIARCHKG